MAAIYCKIPGIISDNEGHPLPREFIAHELNCPIEVLNSVIDKGSQDNCLRDTMNGLQLVNFEHYQFTEYDRQKPYRQAKKANMFDAPDPGKYTRGRLGQIVKQRQKAMKEAEEDGGA